MQPCVTSQLEASAPMSTSPSPTMRAHPHGTPAAAPRDAATNAMSGSCTPWLDKDRVQRWSERCKDFDFGKVLEEGAFGKVVLGREVATSTEYAIKILKKKKIVKMKKVRYVTTELDIMARLDHPFCVQLHCAFQDQENLYFVLNYARNGDLQRFVEKVGPLDEPCTRFYSAEIVLALEYLHGLDIIHRDLKPENILINGDLHIQITDFGLAKILLPGDEQARAKSFVGTTNYMSPEVLLRRGACKSSDLWALGGVIYHLVTGLLPFEDASDYLIHQKILSLQYDIPEFFFPRAKDLLRKLLVLDSSNRLGCEEMGGYGALKDHPFFQNIAWDDLHLQTPPAVNASLHFISKDKNEEFEILDFLQSLPPSSSAHCVAAAEPSSHPPSTALVEGYIQQLDENSLELDLKFSEGEKRLLLEKQAHGNPWHEVVDNHLILKMGPVDSRKGFFNHEGFFTGKGLFPKKSRFVRRYQLILTEGPHLYYVDPNNKDRKGEFPWSAQLWPEAKNCRIFLIHTLSRTYRLIDPNGNAHNWCQKIQELSQSRFQYHPWAAANKADPGRTQGPGSCSLLQRILDPEEETRFPRCT